MLKGYLKVIILKELDFEENTGYELMAKIGNITGEKPSPGSIYPALSQMYKNKLISVKEEGRKKIYSITEKGRKAINRFIEEREDLTLKHTKLCEIIEGKRCSKPISDLIQKIKSKNYIPKNIDVFSELGDTVIKIILKKDYDKKSKEIRKIIRDTIKRLNSI